MIQEKQIGKLTQLTSTNGFIHKIGTEIYAKALVMLPNETTEMYEEVDKMPPYTKTEYDTKVAELVRERYSESEEFAIQRKAINAAFSPSTMSIENSNALEEYAEYNAFVEECKAKAPQELERLK